MAAIEDEVIDLARHRPVAYLETRILSGGKIVDQRVNYERYAINAGHYPSHLTDGRDNTYAYSASWFFDYIIDLEHLCNVRMVRLAWGSFGQEEGYITEWKLYSQKAYSQSKEPTIDDWDLVQSGGFPKEKETILTIDITSMRFRIMAASVDRGTGRLLNWIGITSFEAHGKRCSA